MNPDPLKLGITASALGDDLRAIPKAARTLGFAGIQYDAYSNLLDITQLSASGRREFLSLLSAQDRQLIGLRFDAGAKGFGPGADIDRILDRLDKVLQSAAESGSPLVCLDVGPLPSPPRTTKPKPVITQDALGLILLPPSASHPAPAPETPAPPIDPAIFGSIDSALAELGARADRYSVIIAFRSELASFAAIERALRATSCPWFGLDLDPAAVLGDEWEMDEVFSRLGPWIRHVRGRDAIVGTDRRTKPAVVGVGNTDWGSLLANLDASGYQGWITIDPTELTDRVGAAEIAKKRLQAIVGPHQP